MAGRPRTVTDEQILQAAREVFLRDGPGAPVADVAAKLGVSHAALFQRLGNKESLLRAALGPPPVERFLEIFARPAGERPRAQLATILEQLLAILRRVLPCLVVLHSAGLSPSHQPTDSPPPGSQGPPSYSPPPMMLRAMLRDWLRDAVDRELLPEHDPTIIAELLLGTLEARCFNAHLGGSQASTQDGALTPRALIDTLLPAR